MSPLVLATALVLGPAPAGEEQSGSVGLSWQAPSRCPQREMIDARLHELLPELDDLRPVGDAGQLRVRGRIELAEPDRWEITLEFESERGVDERRFSGPNCVVLADAAALVIAVALDPVAVAQTITIETAEDEPEAMPEDTVEIPPEPSVIAEARADEEPSAPTVVIAPPTEPDLVRRDEEPPRVRFSLGLLGGGGYGPLRLAQAGVGLELGVLGRGFRASVRGLWLPPRRQAFAGGDEARFDGFAIAARGCGVPTAGPVEFPICAGIEAGALRGRGSGATADPREANIPWAAVLVGPGLRWLVIDRIALGVDLDLLVPLVRGGFTIDGTVVQQLSPVGVQALAGVELRLP